MHISRLLLQTTYECFIGTTKTVCVCMKRIFESRVPLYQLASLENLKQKEKKEQKSQSEFREFIILKQCKKDLTSEDP